MDCNKSKRVVPCLQYIVNLAPIYGDLEVNLFNRNDLEIADMFTSTALESPSGTV